MFKVNAKAIRDFLFERRLSLREFARQSGLNELTASKVTKDGATVTTRTIAALAKFFNVDGDSLILAN